MHPGNTALSIQAHDPARTVAVDDDAFQHVDSASSTPLAGRNGNQIPSLVPSTRTAPASVPVSDELERFRSEWRKEVEARGLPMYAQPPSSSAQPSHDPRSTTQPLPSSSRPVQTEQSSTSHLAVAQDAQQGQVFGEELSDQHSADPSHHDSPLPAFPEAEIYAPAALKYSKCAHKIPRPSTQLPTECLPAPLVPAEYISAPIDPSSSSALASTSSVANGVSHALRERIRAGGPSTTSTSSSTSLATDAESSSQPLLPSRTSHAPRIMATPHAPAHASQSTQAGMRSAVEAYAHAVEMERSGQLDQALASYRRAFKLNSNADRLYHRAHLLLTDPALANTSTHQNDALLSSPAIADKVRKALDFDDHRYVAIKERQAKETEARARGEPLSPLDPKSGSATTTAATADAADKPPKTLESRPDELAKLLDKLSLDGGGARDFGLVAFEPEDEEKEMPIAKLPDEVLLHILKMVIAPRGRRGAKVVKPKPTPEEQAALDAATAALTGRAGVKPGPVANGDAQNPSKAGPVATATATGSAAKGVKKNVDAAQSANASSNTAAFETLANGEKATTDSNQAGAVPATRKQPLGIGVVLGGSDWQSLEIVGRTCWKLRLLTKSPSLWREIVRETYYPPILDPALSLTTLYERNHSDWRTAFVNQPRVRLNGCYIAACHYARPGLSEDAWVRVIHVVEFYRSIRFLPDGTALSLLTTDSPSETVRRLEPALKAKGFAKGRWELFEQGLEDDEEEGRPRGPKVVVEDLRDRSMHKYAFRMVFGLRSTTRGRWNKLDLLEYYSVNLTNGEVLPLPQKHSRPFHFSRVIAYGV